MNKLLIFICLYCSCLQAQIKSDFINHLAEKQLKQEHFAYLNSLDAQTTTADSLNYYKARFYLQYFNDSLFRHYYFQSISISSTDSILFQKANCTYFTLNEKVRNTWFSDERNNTLRDQRFVKLYSASLNPLTTDIETIPTSLQSSFIAYRKSYVKKPVAAALISTVVPGMGMYYAGRKRSALNVFATHLIFGAQLYESVKVLGIQHPFNIISLSVFGLFYASNIYGSFTDVNKVKKELKTQYYHEVSNYYYTPSVFDLQ